ASVVLAHVIARAYPMNHTRRVLDEDLQTGAGAYGAYHLQGIQREHFQWFLDPVGIRARAAGGAPLVAQFSRAWAERVAHVLVGIDESLERLDHGQGVDRRTL